MNDILNMIDVESLCKKSEWQLSRNVHICMYHTCVFTTIISSRVNILPAVVH